LGVATSQLYDLADGRLVASYPSAEWNVPRDTSLAITNAAFSPNGDRLVTYHVGDRLRLWDISQATPRLLATQAMLMSPANEPYQHPRLAFSGDGAAVSCLTNAMWMGDGYDLACRLSKAPVSTSGLDAKFSADGRWALRHA